MRETVCPSIPTLKKNSERAYLVFQGGRPTLFYDESVRDANAASIEWLWFRPHPVQLLISNPALIDAIGGLSPRLASIVSMLRALGSSSLMVDLTKAMGLKHPLEEERTLNEWVHTAAIPVPDSHDRVVRLMDSIYEHCACGVWTTQQRDLVERLERDEQKLVNSSDPYEQFAIAHNNADAWAALHMSDPVARSSYMGDGTVVGGTVTAISRWGGVSICCDKPMKIRSGKTAVILHPEKGYPGGGDDVSLVKTTVHSDGTYVLHVKPVRGGLRAAVGDSVEVMEKPFLMPTFVRRSKWSSRTPAPPTARSLPDWLHP